MNKNLVSFLETTSGYNIDWLFFRGIDGKYNQIKAFFNNGWEISIAFGELESVFVQHRHTQSEFFNYDRVRCIEDVLEIVLRVRDYSEFGDMKKDK